MSLADDFSDFLTAESQSKEQPCKTIVRLTTSYWHDKSGAYIKKSLKVLRRQSQGYNILMEDADNIGAKEVLECIINLDECEDGIYQVVTCNESHDWEMPNILDDYDYQLVPLKKVDAEKPT